MTEGHVSHAQQQGVHVLRYHGTVNYLLAPSIQRFMDHLIQNGPIWGLVFDLTQANSLDSTNLGLMARVNERLLDHGAANSVIISGKADIDSILYSMGFDQTFDLMPNRSVNAEPEAAPIETSPPSALDLRRTMLAAHQALVRMSEAGRLQFQPVVQCLELAGSDGARDPQ